MAYITTAVTIIVTLIVSLKTASAYLQDYNYVKQYTRSISTKQGVLQGIVVKPKINPMLPYIEQYKGIPYAAAPVGDLRFMPSRNAPSWSGIKYADSFGPVCPQNFPDTKTMAPQRREAFLKLKEYLLNQSEDCLYLNVYAPFQEEDYRFKTYPVMVFIHGESFEWNSGNPYDGSVLAGYGNVIVVTLNFRLGILGFLKAGTEEDSNSNFGLVDQIAALLWVKENIAAFGGDPDSVTLFGHGTGAVCASLLTLSPMVLPGNQMLFQRAILMGGTALSDWALAGNPREVTYQVAQALNCQIQDDFEACLRRKRLDEIMGAAVETSTYRTRFGPVVDSRIVPNDPIKSMTNYTSIFRRFELIYGLTELESVHLLGPIATTQGMLEKERDQELRRYLRQRCEMKPELCVASTLAEYTDVEFSMNEAKYGGFTGHEPDRASMARDSLLDILSDAKTAAPVAQMAKYHAALNPQSYFYIFSHKTESKEYLRNKSFSGEELPYVFGIPLDGSSFHFMDQYTDRERLFSEIIMTYFCNFAYSRNPNVRRKNEYYTLKPIDWMEFDIDWPEFDVKQQRYLQLDTPPRVYNNYRRKQITYWNEIFPKLINSSNPYNNVGTIKPLTIKRPKGTPPWILAHPNKIYENKFENFHKPFNEPDVYGTIVSTGTTQPDHVLSSVEYGTVLNSPADLNKGSSTNVLIIVGAVFLFLNVFLFAGLYYKCYRLKKIRNLDVKHEDPEPMNENNEKRIKFEEETLVNGCNLIKIISKSSKSDDTYEALRASGGSNKLTRQLSNSTIDAHTKVRDWIAHEIVHKYSPKFLRRPRQTPLDIKTSTQTNNDEILSLNTDILVKENDSTLGRCPTRPVTPSGDFKPKPLFFKTSTLQSQKGKKPDKVSVAIDATPTGRGPSVLAQQPLEFTKSLDYPHYMTNEIPLRRSMTLEDFSPKTVDKTRELRKSITNVNLNMGEISKPTLIKIEHAHSKSEPVQDLYSYIKSNRMRTFDPDGDINVTSRDEIDRPIPLTAEESLMTIKRRNFPKVLPDYPSKEALAQKRRSMPTHSLFSPIPEAMATSRVLLDRLPNRPKPPPPVRTTSTLGRKPVAPIPIMHPVCVSAPMLVEETTPSPEPEISYNNLYVGPLIPRKKITDSNNVLNTTPVYSSLSSLKETIERKNDVSPRVIVTTDSEHPVKKTEPKIVIKPKMVRNMSDPKSRIITRVTAADNNPNQTCNMKSDEAKTGILKRSDSVEQPDNPPGGLTKSAENLMAIKCCKHSLIPSPVKNTNTKESSGSESSPSEESDTGTVVKRA